MIGAIIVAIIIAIPTILLAGPSSPWEEAVLAHGRTYLDVPLSTLYTAPPLPNGTVNTSVELSFNSGNLTCSYGTCRGDIMDYVVSQWSLVSGNDLPVDFVMGPTSPTDSQRRFDAGPGDWFEFFPAGYVSTNSTSYLNASVTGPGIRAVFVSKWAMDYTVRKMGVSRGLSRISFLEVDYSLTVVDRGSLLALPAANVSLPSPSDLWMPQDRLSLNARDEWSLTGIGAASFLRNPPIPGGYGPVGPYFHYNVTPISLDAGAGGTLVAGLTLNFHSSYSTVNFSFGNQTVWFRASVDMRFGSVLLDYIMPPPV